MIEVPRAAVTADEMAQTAEFFSFGTNDLTQMTFGYSRDDVNSFLPDYLKKEILERDPFQTLDVGGVGQLIQMAVTKGRSVRPDLKCGICGEHGGDPKSIAFLPQGWTELRELLPLSRADRAARGGACGDHPEHQTRTKWPEISGSAKQIFLFFDWFASSHESLLTIVSLSNKAGLSLTAAPALTG